MAAKWTQKEIIAREKKFLKDGRDTNNKVFEFTTNAAEPFIDCRLKDQLDKKYHIQYQHPKTQIVLHFTVGGLPGDVQVLTNGTNGGGSVSFVIAQGGTILRLWDEKYWSKHLGPNAVGGNEAGSRKTIGIELCNVGPLQKKGGKLYCINGKAFYCYERETKLYVDLKKDKFRGEQYFATFSNEQYKSLISLLGYLTDKYPIPRTFISKDKRYLTGTKSELEKFKGILTHVNYRHFGKWDFGPAFDWEKVISGVKKQAKKPPAGKKKEKAKTSDNSQSSKKSGKKYGFSKKEDDQSSKKSGNKYGFSKKEDDQSSKKSGNKYGFSKK